MQAYIEILNTGGGDIRIEFQEQEGEEGADAGTLEAGHLERWLAEHVVCHIPGGNGERK